MTTRRTSPDHDNKSWPPGVPYIIGNEGCERFSYYGMRSILQVHLAMLFALQMGLEKDSELAKQEATALAHLFYAGVYAFPIIGALLADRLFGKYNVILWLSLVYCAGHGVLAIGENSLTGMYLGLGLIAIGSGGIKPCVSANVGDQFGRGNWHLVEKVFAAFYWMINVGSFTSTLLIPWTREAFGTSVAFGIPGILMFMATIVYWLGRDKYVHVPPRPAGKTGALDVLAGSLLFMPVAYIIAGPTILHTMDWSADFSERTVNLGVELSYTLLIGIAISIVSVVAGFMVFGRRQKVEQDDGFLAVLSHAVVAFFRGDRQPAPEAQGAARHPFWASAAKRFGHDALEGPIAVLRIMVVFSMISVFWALFDQHSTTWVRQAEMMELTLPLVGEIKPSQIQAANPAFVMALIPLCTLLLYPFMRKVGMSASPLQRMSIGLFITAASFAWIGMIQGWITGAPEGEQINIAWQLPAWLILTLGEVMVSVTGLEFAYTQAPKRMKSTIMGFYLLTVTAGNILVAVLATIDVTLGQSFWLYAGMCAAAGVVFTLLAKFYKGKTYTQ